MIAVLMCPALMCIGTLANNRAEYIEFVRDLARRNMVNVVRPGEVKCRVGIFFVCKKDGRIRLIVDARAVNALCKEPPRTELASTAAVVELETIPSNEYTNADNNMYFLAQDISN